MNDLTNIGKDLAAWKSSYFKMFGEPSYTRDEFINCLIEGEATPIEGDPYGPADEISYTLDVEGVGKVSLVDSNVNSKDAYVVGSVPVRNGEEIWVIFSVNSSKYYRILGTYYEDPCNMYIDNKFGHIWDDVSTVVELTHYHQVIDDTDVYMFTYEDWVVFV